MLLTETILPALLGVFHLHAEIPLLCFVWETPNPNSLPILPHEFSPELQIPPNELGFTCTVSPAAFRLQVNCIGEFHQSSFIRRVSTDCRHEKFRK